METTYKLDGHAVLTTDHSASSYGIPVLVDDRYDPPISADDRIPGGSLRGQDYVGAYYRVGDALPDLVLRYLAACRRPIKHTVDLIGAL
jgi:hypothetical protein